jgi:hypothetical protein
VLLSQSPAHLESRWLYVLWILLAFVLMLLKRVQTSDGKPQPAFVSTGNQATKAGPLTQKKARSLATSASWHLDTFRASLLRFAFPLTAVRRFISARPFRDVRRDAF